MSDTWNHHIRLLHPEWSDRDYFARFNAFMNSRERWFVGDVVSGVVVAHESFGAWILVEPGHEPVGGFPGVLLESDMLKSKDAKQEGQGYPELGATIRAEINIIKPFGRIGLFQLPTSENAT